MEAFEIQQNVDAQIKELKITSLDISFNELADMYSEGELIIKPNYQRTFRWATDKQSRFIESLLLEMPIPPIYVIEVEDGKYELIDGLQRISSYLCYRSMYRIVEDNLNTDNLDANNEYLDDEVLDEDIENSSAKNGFELVGCDIVKSLNGLRYDDLPANLKIKAKRAFIRMEILRKGINPELKYHMFKRLNTGGENLSAQEIRNCSIRIIDSTFIDFINKLASNPDFQSTISRVSNKTKAKKFSEELVLRFFALKNNFDGFSHKVDDFLTHYMEMVAISDAKGSPVFDYKSEQDTFERTFKTLNEALGEKSFSVYKGNSHNLTGFNVYQFEAITYGVQKYINDNDSYSIDILREKLKEVKQNEEFKKATVGGGKNSPGVLKQRCALISEYLGRINNVDV